MSNFLKMDCCGNYLIHSENCPDKFKRVDN